MPECTALLNDHAVLDVYVVPRVEDSGLVVTFAPRPPPPPPSSFRA